MKKNIKQTAKGLLSKVFVIALAAFFAFSCTDKVDERYVTTFTGEMIYSYLKKDSVEFSEFIDLINKAKLKGMLSAYGEYTCLAPTNDAFASYYQSRGENFTSADLTEEELNYIVRTHIVNLKYITDDLTDGVFPNVNMNDRSIEVKFGVDTISGKSKILLTGDAQIIAKDIEVHNGIIHIINKVIVPESTELPGLIAKEGDLTIFSAALELTGMKDSIMPIADFSYNPDLYEYKDEYNSYIIPTPKSRKYGFTAFVESDSVFAAHNINSIDDLIQKAEEWYPSPGYENKFTNRNNSLNKFISYHLIEKVVNNDKLFIKTSMAKDIELYEFLETMYTDRIMKTSNQNNSINITAGEAAFINPNCKDVVTIYNNSKTTVNGVLYRVNNILRYSTDGTTSVEYMLQNTRIRFDFAALLPEMMNNNLRLSNEQNNSSGDRFGIPPGYFKYVKQSKDTRFVYLAGKNLQWHNFQGDEMMGLGNYDITVRLLPVPPGTYELRFGYSGNTQRSVTQIYVDGQPIGIPLDLRMSKTDPKVGWVSDLETDDGGLEIDKAMRNRGFMNASQYMLIGSSKSLREEIYPMRRIVGTFTFDTYEPHVIRFRSVLDKPDAQAQMDYFEYVPKSVFAPAGGEPESRD